MYSKQFNSEQNYLNKVKQNINLIIQNYTQNINYFVIKNNENKIYSVSNKMDPEEENFMLTEMEKNTESITFFNNEILQLSSALNNPYFAKIDRNFNNNKQSHYIGLKGISDREKIYVTDWRAPVSSLYYDSEIGPALYITAEGKNIKVDLLQKRQFKIKDGSLIYYFDTNLEITDNILQQVLSESTSFKMRNIVQTIQKEQNVIIKNNFDGHIVVNGTAGSGKTSVAIHRIAYMLYKFKGTLNNENFVFISPNKLFSGYISSLLPELNEENIPTFCFDDILKINKLKLNSSDSKLNLIEILLKGNKLREKDVKYKYSYKFLNDLNVYLKLFNIEKIYNNILSNFNLTKIFINKIIEKYKNSPNIYNSVNSMLQTVVEHQFPDWTEKKIENLTKKLTTKTMSQFNLKEMYVNFINKHSSCVGRYNNYENLPSYAYIKMMIRGFKPNNMVKAIIIDEMQDYDCVSLEIIKNLYPNAKFTMVGDYNQNLLFNNSNINYIKYILTEFKYFIMQTSYRSTNNITKFANDILKIKYNQTEVRKGSDPVIYITDELNIVNNIKSYINKLDINQKTAIICKTVPEANKLSKYFKEAQLLLSDEKEIITNLVITIPFFSKGLEFDNVILYNVSKNNYKTDIDKQQLYIAVSRALHNVAGFSIDEKSRFIPQKYIKLC